jgi:hypothetical protein
LEPSNRYEVALPPLAWDEPVPDAPVLEVVPVPLVPVEVDPPPLFLAVVPPPAPVSIRAFISM